MDRSLYDLFLKKLPLAYAVHRVLYDGRGKPADYVMEDLNEELARMLEVRREDVLGKRYSEVVDSALAPSLEWLDIFGGTALSGEPCQTEYYSHRLQKWLRIYAYSPEPAHCLAFFLDITDSVRRADENLQLLRMINETVADVEPDGTIRQFLTGQSAPPGADLEAMVGHTLRQVMEPLEAEAIHAAMARTSATGTCQTLITSYESLGRRYWYKTRVCRHNRRDGKHYILSFDDMTEAVVNERALRESERSKTVLLAHLPGMAYRRRADSGWTLQFASEGCRQLTGYAPESLINNRDLSFRDLIAPEYRPILEKEWRRVLLLHGNFRYEYEIITASGERKWVLEMGQGVFSSGTLEALEGLVIDITDQKTRELHIHYLQDHDFMTGLFNRRYFERERERLDKPANLPLALLIVDVNGLRLINNAYGYEQGDRLIMETSRILQDYCASGLIARLGGDDFGVLMPRTGPEEAAALIDRIRRESTRRSGTGGGCGELNLSVGVCVKTAGGTTMQEVFRSAEESLSSSRLLNRRSTHGTILSSIMATLYARSQETEEHSERLSSLSRMIGARLGLSRTVLDELQLLAMLHDIGKVGIDDSVLNKPGRLTEEEWVTMRKHPEIGYHILRSSAELEPIAEYVLSHHERWDGTGYPRGLRGEEIPLPARILAVADAYDAMTQNRVYRRALPPEEAVRELKTNAGTQFDPRIVTVFLDCMEERRFQTPVSDESDRKRIAASFKDGARKEEACGDNNKSIPACAAGAVRGGNHGNGQQHHRRGDRSV